MKSWVVHIGVLAALLACCYLYARKFSVPGRQDMLVASLSGVLRFLPAGSTVKLVNFVPSANAPTVDLFPSFISFVLAPASISGKAIATGDTLLVLLPADADRGMADSLMKGRSVLWSNKDSAYQYLLIH